MPNISHSTSTMKLTSMLLPSIAILFSLTTLSGAVFPCCICQGCTCSHTSCPEVKRSVRDAPSISWTPTGNHTDELVLESGCGDSYSIESCLTFVHQLLESLSPSLQVHSSSDLKHERPCCGPTCSDSSCLTYLATTVGHLQLPITGMLAARD